MRTLTALMTALLFAVSPAPAVAADDRSFSEAELQQLLAPVALHPDSVLSNILIAATYPLEVVQAARWTRDNPGLDGEEAIAAVQDRDWDPSVKALVAFPDVLARMDSDLDWMQRVGDAFMFQEALVMDTIQDLRDRAYAAGNLRTNDHVRVVREPRSIAIEPVRREVVYVPYYDTRVVYGPWWQPAYPPVYWSHPRGYRSSVAFHWSRPVYVSPSFYYSSFFWPQRHIVVINAHRHPPRRWHHTPRRRPPVYHDTNRPRRDAHREWADGRRETFPRGLRGPSRQVRTPGTLQRPQVRPHQVESQRRPQRQVPRTYARQPDAARTPIPQRRTQRPAAVAPTLDAGRPMNQFESRGVDRSRLQAQRRQALPQPRSTVRAAPPRAAASRPARAARTDAPERARGEPSRREGRSEQRER